MPDAALLAASGRLAKAEAAPVLATVDRNVFVTLPSPGYLAAAGSALASAADIDAVRAAGQALAAILRDEIAALAADGVLFVPLENPLYAPLLTVEGRAAAAAAGIDVPAALAALIEADRAVFDGLEVHADFRVGLDLTDAGPLPLTGSAMTRRRSPRCSTRRRSRGSASTTRPTPPPASRSRSSSRASWSASA